MTREFDGHTPAPWRAADEADGYRIDGHGNPAGTVALLATRRSATGAADARLIAAAPRLLAERDALAADVKRLREAAAQVIDCLDNGGGYSDDERLWNESCNSMRAALAASEASAKAEAKAEGK